MARRPRLRVDIDWWPFLLHPDMPPDGIDRDVDLLRRFGSETRIGRVFGAIAAAGQSADIPFAFDRIDRTPSTLDAHRLVRFADRIGRADDAVEALFAAYFIDGRDIGDTGVLTRIGLRIGLDGSDLRRHLRGDDDIIDVRDLNARAHRLGVGGVPAFLFAGTTLITGAQDPAVLARMLDVAASMASF